MTPDSHTRLVDAPLSDPSPTRTHASSQPAKNDPLVAKGWENAAYLGSALLLVGTVAIVGLISRKIEHVIIAALILSLILIGFFLFVGH